MVMILGRTGAYSWEKLPAGYKVKLVFSVFFLKGLNYERRHLLCTVAKIY